MSVIYNKIKDGNICIEFLEDEIQNSSISQELELIIVNDNYYIQATFSDSLSQNEEIILDNIILNHNCDNTETGVDFDEFATVQISNSGALTITPTNLDTITFDTILIENKPEIILDAGTNSGIFIKENSLYNVSFNAVIDCEASITYFQLYIIRDGNEIPISNSEKIYTISDALPWTSYNYTKQNSIINVDIDLNLSLLTNDTIIIKSKKIINPNLGNSGYNYYSFPTSDYNVNSIILPNGVLSVTKLTGAKGEPGVAGPSGESSLIIKKQGAIKSTGVEKLNFVGNVSVTDDGDDQTTITVLTDNNNFSVHQIYGADNVISEPMAFLVDSTREDKLLSIESTAYQFGERNASNNDWLIINDANNTEAGFSVPYDGTIVRASARISNTGGSGEALVYVNDNGHSVLNWNNYDSILNSHCTNINIPFNKDDIIRVRTENVNSTLKDCVVTIWVKWEVRN